MTNINAYETLYNNMKRKFTVTSDNSEYTLGDYMLMKANARKENTSLPVARTSGAENRSVAAIFSYVNEKLTVKKAPAKDKTIRAFPFRTSAAALLSAVVACALIFSYGIFTLRSAGNVPTTVDAGEDTTVSESYDVEATKK